MKTEQAKNASKIIFIKVSERDEIAVGFPKAYIPKNQK